MQPPAAFFLHRYSEMSSMTTHARFCNGHFQDSPEKLSIYFWGVYKKKKGSLLSYQPPSEYLCQIWLLLLSFICCSFNYFYYISVVVVIYNYLLLVFIIILFICCCCYYNNNYYIIIIIIYYYNNYYYHCQGCI